jgi:hypothetical protein
MIAIYHQKNDRYSCTSEKLQNNHQKSQENPLKVTKQR